MWWLVSTPRFRLLDRELRYVPLGDVSVNEGVGGVWDMMIDGL
jgi:hypothetical protein